MILAYCLLSMVLGRAGIISQGAMHSRITAMDRKVEDLRSYNTSLTGEMGALTSDAGRLAQEARKIGYLKPDETKILLIGVTAGKPVAPVPNGSGIEDVLRIGEVSGLSDILIKELALVLGAGVFMMQLLLRSGRKAGTLVKTGASAETA